MSVEDGLSQSEPLRLVFRWVGKFALGGGEHSEGPESLIVVTEGEGLRRGLVVVVLPDLIEHGLAHEFIELVVTGVVPILDPSLQPPRD